MFAPHGNALLTGSDDGTCRLWELFGGSCTQLITGRFGVVEAAEFNYLGDRIVIAGKNNVMSVLSAAKSRMRRKGNDSAT
jgi:WD40 repeat protein